MHIRHCEPQDVAQICDIYNHYIVNTAITFEEIPLSVDAMKARIASYTQAYPWLVCCDGDEIVGYAYATKWKERAAYRHTVETTVYLRDGFSGQGHGKALCTELLAALSRLDCHIALACIALPHAASVGLHEHLGFKQVAHFTEVGRKFGQWLDVGYWQKRLQAEA